MQVSWLRPWGPAVSWVTMFDRHLVVRNAGFLVTPLGSGCQLGYVAHSDPGGKLPSWVTNKLSTVLAPKVRKR